MEKMIELTPLAEIGRGCVRITDDSIDIEINGISGGMKAWLIGGEAVAIGNIVNGRLCRNIDTKSHTGVLITQSGRQMLIGRYGEEEEIIPEEKPENNLPEEVQETPFGLSEFNWKKITEKSFEGINSDLRFILCNKSVYDNYKRYRHYWVGDCEESGALALKYDEDGADPLEFLGKMKITREGYVRVCIDKKTNKLYIPD